MVIRDKKWRKILRSFVQESTEMIKKKEKKSENSMGVLGSVQVKSTKREDDSCFLDTEWRVRDPRQGVIKCP